MRWGRDEEVGEGGREMEGGRGGSCMVGSRRFHPLHMVESVKN